MKPSSRIFIVVAGLFFATSCNNAGDTTSTTKKDSAVVEKKVDSAALKSAGIYSGYIPCPDCPGISTFLLLNPDMTYRMEETYAGKNDSVVRLNGNWKYDNGKIIVYEGENARVSYMAHSDRLQQLGAEDKPISGNLGDKFMLSKNTIANNPAWEEKKNAGLDFIGVGNEPFWNIEIYKNGSITMNSPNFKAPVKMPYTDPVVNNDKRQYHVEADGNKLDISLVRQFCSDGMSDFIYEYKVQVTFNGKKYSGCGSLLGTL